MLSDVCSVLIYALTVRILRETPNQSISRPKLVVNEEGTLMVKFSEEPYQPPPEPTEKEIGQSKDLLRRMREAAGK